MFVVLSDVVLFSILSGLFLGLVVFFGVMMLFLVCVSFGCVFGVWFLFV